MFILMAVPCLPALNMQRLLATFPWTVLVRSIVSLFEAVYHAPGCSHR
jgi:hypothetical protein